ncbi:YrhK family protein [Streptomyces sp. JJ36]|uniref:YrhK family protein n=1 Tax=Streptomyces sp. JJ36 TaxID=2736645 RepID=UPI001F2D65B2|nr:YrhK family protein [Streptomyces sp. JJ36]MCF6523127.1 YrhK family protein [Streptomyces sp. JJ36]
MSETTEPSPLTVRVGPQELVVRRRYETLSILNDVLIALWFIAGSVMFFSEEWTTTGTWCFLFGSLELLIRPVVRLSRQVHLRRLRAVHGSGPESSQDF